MINEGMVVFAEVIVRKGGNDDAHDVKFNA